MKYYPFKKSGDINLACEFQAGFLFYELKSDKFLRPYKMSLVRADGSGLTFRSLLYDIAPRLEVGSLLIEKFSNADFLSEQLELPLEFRGELQLCALLVTEEHSEIENGLVITGRHGQELYILPGEMPFSIYVQSSFLKDPFRAEYNLADYRRVDLTPEAPCKGPELSNGQSG